MSGRRIEDLVDGVTRSILAGWKGAPSGVSYGGGARGTGARHNTYPGARIDPEREEERETFLEKRLRHVEDLTDEEWSRFAEAIRRGEMEVSEKVDGAARLEFGVREGRLWFKTKNGPMVESAVGMPIPVVAAFGALSSVREGIVRRWPQGLQSVVCEVLYGRVPNTIEYGPNALVVHGATREAFDRLFDGLKIEGWLVEYKPRFCRPPFAGMDLATPQRFRECVLEHIRGWSSSFGPADGIMEGLVFSGPPGTFKVVDRSMFTELNRFMWRFREELDRGLTVGESYVPGVLGEVRRKFAEHTGCKTIMYSRLAETVAEKHGGSLKGFLESRGITSRHLVTFRGLAEAAERTRKLAEQYSESPKTIVLEGRTFSVPDEVRERTERAFENTTARLRSMVEATRAGDTVTFVESLLGPGFTIRMRALREKVQIGAGTRLIAANADRIQKRGWNVTSIHPLGAGTQGTAFDMGDKVLKVTHDAKEAAAALLLKGKPVEHLYKVFDVFRFAEGVPDEGKFKRIPTYGIVQEKLKKLGSQEEAEIGAALEILRDATEAMMVEFDYSSWEDFESSVWNRVVSGQEDEAQKALDFLKKYDVDLMMQETVAHGIKFKDYHAGNIMKRGSTYVLIDLGYSQSAMNPEQIPVLENEIARIVRESLIKEQDPAQADPAEAQKILSAHAQLLLAKKRINVGQARPLGSGTQGTAFDIGGNRVLKVTKDSKEAVASFKIANKNMKYVAKVFDVFRFKDTDMYGVVLEKLTPLSDSEKKEFRTLLVKTRLPIYVYYSGYDWDRALEMMYSELAGKKVSAAELDQAVDALEQKYHCKEILEELSGEGIKFHDFSDENLMKRGSEYVMTDIGLSKVEGGAEPPVLEKKTLEVDDDEKTEDGYEVEAKYLFQGLPIVVENEKGSSREWTDKNGKTDRTRMKFDYGYIQGFEGADGDSIDVYIGPNEKSEWIFVVHQTKTPDFTEFDEDKVMLGFKDEAAAKKAYLAHYDDDRFYGGMSAMKIEDFKWKLEKQSGKKITNELRRIIGKIIREANGNIVTAYHGGPKGLTKLDYFQTKRMPGTLGPGIYLTPDRKMAAHYKRDAGVLYTVEVDVSGLVDSWGKDWQRIPGIEKFSSELNPAMSNATVFQELSRPGRPKSTYFDDDEEILPLMEPEEFLKMMRGAGITGTKAMDNGSETFAVFDPQAMKIVQSEQALGEANVTSLAQRHKIPLALAQRVNDVSPKNSDVLLSLYTDHMWRNDRNNLDDVRSFQEFYEDEGGLLTDMFLKREPTKGPALVGMTRDAKFNGHGTLERIKDAIAELSSVEDLSSRAILKFSDGSYWVKLEKGKCGREGHLMQHCGSAQGDMYSFRDKSHRPHVTAEIQDSDSGSVLWQARGKQNKTPDRKYWAFVEALCRKLDVKPESVIATGEFAKWLVDRLTGEQTGTNERIERFTEAFVSSLKEDRDPETVGVTIGRFQPFHKGHAEMIRKLAKEFKKVILLVAGNKRDKDNPFSYDLRLEMIQRSLPDLANRLEVHLAEFQGKFSGFVPGILSELIEEDVSSIDRDTAFSIMVGPDRYQNVLDQFERARQYPDLGLNLDLIVVKQMPEVSDSEGRISGTRVREMLSSGADLKDMFDPHLTSDETNFQRLVGKMRSEMGLNVKKEQFLEFARSLPDPGTTALATGALQEKLSSVGEKGIQDTLRMNSKRLQMVKGIDVNRLHALGHGQMGIAYDMGDGHVLKVTTDVEEARASNLIKGRNMTHVVQVFDVFRFKRAAAKEPLYGVVQEKLTPLSESEKGEFRHAIAFVRENGQLLEMLATRSWDEFVKAIYAFAYEDAQNELSADATEKGGRVDRGNALFQKQARRAAESKQSFVISRLQKFGVDKMSQELQAAGIQFADYHEGNLMKRGGQFIITDLGASKSKGPEPDVFEGLLQGVIERVLDEIGGNGPGFGFGSSQTGVRAQSSPWSSGAALGSVLPRKTRRLTSPDEMDDEEDR